MNDVKRVTQMTRDCLVRRLADKYGATRPENRKPARSAKGGKSTYTPSPRDEIYAKHVQRMKERGAKWARKVDAIPPKDKVVAKVAVAKAVTILPKAPAKDKIPAATTPVVTSKAPMKVPVKVPLVKVPTWPQKQL